MDSEELKKLADAEDNDLKALGMYAKHLREKRFEKSDAFIEKIKAKGYPVEYIEGSYKFSIDTDFEKEKYGIIDFFPKVNKILIRKRNKWIKPGLDWLLKNL